MTIQTIDQSKLKIKKFPNIFTFSVAQINAHIVRVSQYGSCRPKMTVIPIAHNPMKTYNPHCTVLHRCTDGTGCCHTDYSTCQPRRIQSVTLPFYVRSNWF